MPRARGHTQADAAFGNWYSNMASPPDNGRRSVIMRARSNRAMTLQSVGKQASVGTSAEVVLHGSQRIRTNNATFVQHMSSAVVESSPPEKLDAVSFSFADRVTSWFSGFGKELRQLKEVHVSEPIGPDGEVPKLTRFERVRRRSLVLLGAEERLVDRGVGAAENELSGISPAGTVRAMTDLMLRAHFEAEAYGTSRAPRVDAEHILETVDDFRTHYPLTFWERLYLRFCSDFTREEKEILLGRKTPQGAAQEELARAREGAEDERGGRRKRLSVSDLAASNYPHPQQPNSRSRPGGESAVGGVGVAPGSSIPMQTPSQHRAPAPAPAASGTAPSAPANVPRRRAPWRVLDGIGGGGSGTTSSGSTAPPTSSFATSTTTSHQPSERVSARQSERMSARPVGVTITSSSRVSSRAAALLSRGHGLSIPDQPGLSNEQPGASPQHSSTPEPPSLNPVMNRSCSGRI
jgi:hypothetical protein